jgi:hypothetical protein
VCFDFLCNFCPKKFFILRRTERNAIKIVYWFSYNVPIVFVRFWWNLKFLDGFSKNPQISWKSVQWKPSRSIRMDGRTDMTELTVVFHNFRNAPKIATSDAFKYALPAVLSAITFAGNNRLVSGENRRLSYTRHLLSRQTRKTTGRAMAKAVSWQPYLIHMQLV